MAILKYFNPTSGEWEFVAASPTAKFTTWKKTAAGGETSLSGSDDNSVTLSYTPGLEQVFLNGVLLVRGTDYTATTGTSITGLSALVASDIVSIICYAPFNVGDAVAKTLIDAKGDLLAGTADNTAGRLAVGNNGESLVADSTASTGLKWDNTQPLVAFDAYFSGTQSISSGVFTKSTLNTENYDTNNNFDSTTNYRFTPNIAGYYQFSAQIAWAAANAGNQMVIGKNGTANGTTGGIRGQNLDASGVWMAFSGLLYLNGSTDYVELFAAHTSGGTKNLSVARMQGILVRKA
jgi:hypothetical protein